MTTDLEALAKRVAALTGPDREIDAEVARAIGMNFCFCGVDEWLCAACTMGIDTTQFPGCGAPLGFADERTSYPSDWREDERLPHYTASVDAAMGLVTADAYPRFARTAHDRWEAHLGFANRGVGVTEIAATAALAITAAALLAHGKEVG